MTGIVERLEAATGPDQELDAAIYRAVEGEVPTEFMGTGVKLSWDASGKAWCYLPGGMRVSFTPPALTASIDSALSLVERKLPGERVAFELFPDHGFCVIKANSDDEYDAEAPTLPLAILLALFRALRKDEGDHG